VDRRYPADDQAVPPGQKEPHVCILVEGMLDGIKKVFLGDAQRRNPEWIAAIQGVGKLEEVA
jgi:hypothetical protein